MAIIKTTEHDLLYLDISEGTYYACSDSDNIYYDSASARTLQDVEVLYTESVRLYSTIPVEGKRYYVWETNELWVYRNGWKVLVGGSKPADGYIPVQTTNKYSLERVDGVSPDSNGILGDGSVCVRDKNRIVKGKLYIDNETNNLVFSSFLGGGLSFLPNGVANTNGTLLINPHMKLSGVKVYSYDNHDYEEVTVATYLANRNVYDDASKYLVYKKYETTVDGYAVYNGQFNTTEDIYVNLEDTVDDFVTIKITKTASSPTLNTHTSTYMTAKDFVVAPSLTTITEETIKALSELTAYDAMGNDIVSDVEINESGKKNGTDVANVITAIEQSTTDGDYFDLTFKLTSTKKCKVFHEGNLTAAALDEIGLKDQILADAVTVETTSENIKQLKLGSTGFYPKVLSSALIGPIQETALDISQDDTINGDWDKATATGFYTNSEQSTHGPSGDANIPVMVYNFGTYILQETKFSTDSDNKFRVGTLNDGSWEWESWSSGNIATRLSDLETTVDTMNTTIQSLTSRVTALETRAGTIENTYQKKIQSGTATPTTGSEGDIFIKIEGS